ncbi:MAG: rhodanese-like domain-containing protein [Deltaproteobacteria bacterium]|nr:rhodanese-like domain-containing protein [Deltaproteobacteria bacterium]MBW1870422.1 rhodanese-like domain-containing protein [Deltaproteobacteria bacterium]
MSESSKAQAAQPSHAGLPGFFSGLGTVIRDAVLITVVFGGLGVLVNLFHPEKIPFIAEKEYETMVPCPVFGGEVNLIEVDDPDLYAKETFLVDARLVNEHAEWKFRQAVNVPYDYLDPTPEEVIKKLTRQIASSRAQRVVVYGDGSRPDSGEQLGKEISGHGIKNVFFVEGGAPALKKLSESAP